MASKKGNRSNHKSDDATVAARVEEVLRIRLDGAQFHDIVQYASEKGWGVSERQLHTYKQRADELLVERFEHDRAKLIARHVAQREALFARAVNGADYRTALSVLADEARLRGLYPAEKTETALTMGVKEFVVTIATDPPAAPGEAGNPPPPGTG